MESGVVVWMWTGWCVFVGDAGGIDCACGDAGVDGDGGPVAAGVPGEGLAFVFGVSVVECGDGVV